MINIDTNHNVYILGAGYSVDAGMPLVNDFMAKMREASDWLVNQNRELELKSIQNVLNFRHEAAAAAYRIKLNIDNIENLFSLASAIDPNGLGDSIINAITATLDYSGENYKIDTREIWLTDDIAKSLKLSSKSDSPSDYTDRNGVRYSLNRYDINIYDHYALILSGFALENQKHKDSVITFNYDLELEKSFDRIKIPYSYELKNALKDHIDVKKDSEKYIPIYKLHGSMNWAFPKKRGDSLTIYNNYIDALNKGKYRLLIPPTWQKTFNGHLQSVWQNAIKSLSTATRIVIIGFSLPETDIHFKYLLAAGLQNNISLREVIFINPEERETMMGKIRNVFQHEYIENNQISYFEGTLSKHFARNDTLMKLNRYSMKMNNN